MNDHRLDPTPEIASPPSPGKFDPGPGASIGHIPSYAGPENAAAGADPGQPATPWPGAITGRGLSESAAGDSLAKPWPGPAVPLHDPARMADANQNGVSPRLGAAGRTAGQPLDAMGLEDVVAIFGGIRAKKELAHFKADRHMLAAHADAVGNLGATGIRSAVQEIMRSSRLQPLEQLGVLLDVIATIAPAPTNGLSPQYAEAEQASPRIGLPLGVQEQTLAQFLNHTLAADALPRREFREMRTKNEITAFENRRLREVVRIISNLLRGLSS
jgi:hypothetical protein